MTSRLGSKTKKKPVDSILSLIDMPAGHLIIEMGVAYQYHGVRPGVKFKADYPKLGKEIWASVQFDLHQALCDGKNIKDGLGAFLNGNNIRELSTAILTVFLAQFSVPLSVAIPATAMVVKLGLTKFCSKKPPKTKTSVKELLAKKVQSRLSKK